MARSTRQAVWLCQASLVGIGLLIFSYTNSAQTDAAYAADAQTVESVTKSDRLSSLVETPARDGKASPEPEQILQVFLPPVLEKSKPAWGSIYNLDGTLLPEQKILINNQEFQSDEFGLLNFTCPDTDSLTIAVLDKQGGKVCETKYFSTAHGIFVSDKNAEAMIDNLDEMTAHGSGEPIISHTPSVIEPLQAFVVVGNNMGNKQGDSDVEIDGCSSDILAGSQRSLVAVSARFLRLGPLKELRVFNRDASSLPTEIDVSRAEVKFEPAGNGKNKLHFSIIGTNLPCAVSVVNQAMKADMRFGGWRLGRQNVFLSPGGQRNVFEIDADPAISADLPGAHIISNGIIDPYSLKTTRTLLSRPVADAGERAETIRLKRRQIFLEAQQVQFNHERQALTKSGKLSAEEDNRLETCEKAISARLYRVEKMLQSRRAVLESDSVDDYARLTDAAADSALSSLEAVVASKDLGFTEARLLKVSGRKATQEHLQSSALLYLPQYASPPAEFLASCRKKYGKRGVIPPPPLTASLMPPPPPYRPAPGDLGPFITEPPPPARLKIEASKNARKHRSAISTPSTWQSGKSNASSRSERRRKTGGKTRAGQKIGFNTRRLKLTDKC